MLQLPVSKIRRCILSQQFVLAAGALLFTFSGCDKPAITGSTAPTTESASTAETRETTPEQQAETTTSAESQEPRPNLIKRRTSEVLNKDKAMAENANLVEVENKINAGDPLTGSLQGYIAIASRANVINFQHQLNLMKAMDDRNPTHAEVLQLLQQTNMDFNALPDYQYYAYDEKEGKFLILEDKQAKEKFFGQK